MVGFKEKVIQGFAWEAVTKLFVQIVSWISTIWVARLLSPSDYGIVGISGLFTEVGIKIAGFGLGNALINRKKLEAQDLSNVFWLSLVMSCLTYSVLFSLAPFASKVFDLPELTNVIRVSALVLVVASIGLVPRSIVTKELRFKLSAIINTFSNLIVTLTVLVFAFVGYGYWSLVLSTLLGEIFIVVSYCLTLRFLPGKPSNIKSAIFFLKYGGNIVIGNIFRHLNAQWGTIFSGYFLGKVVTGHLQMAHTLASLPMQKIGEIFNRVAFPSFSEIQEDRERAKKLFFKMNKLLFMITLPLFLGLAVVAENAIELLLGGKWMAIVVPLQILCVYNVFQVSLQIAPALLEGLGNTRATRNFNILLLPILSVSMFVGVQWGLEAMLISCLLVFPIAYLFLLKQLIAEIRATMLDFFASIWSSLFSGIVMVVAILFFDHTVSEIVGNQWGHFILQIGVGALTYSLAIFLSDRKSLFEIYELVRSK